VREILLHRREPDGNLRVWTHGRADNLRLVRACTAASGWRLRWRRARRDRRAPHLRQLGIAGRVHRRQAPMSLVYRVPEKAAATSSCAAPAPATTVTLVPAESAAMRPLFRALKAASWRHHRPTSNPSSAPACSRPSSAARR
jgi:hypothetical protein